MDNESSEDINSGNIELEKLLEQKERLESLIQDRFTKYVTVMFTDLKGSTSIAERQGDLSSRMLIKDHNSIVFPRIKEYNGVLVKSMGDGTLSYFEDAQNALRAAAIIQKEFTEYNVRKKHKQPILLRIGMHTGDVILEEDDIFGDVVNTASRFESGANPGEINISEETYNALSDKDEIVCRFVKEAMLKGKEEPFKVYKAYWNPEEIKKDLETEAQQATEIQEAAVAQEEAATVAQGAATVATAQAVQAPQDALVLQQANMLKNGNELVQLYLYCEEHALLGAVIDIRQGIITELQQGGAKNTMFFGEEAMWFFKTSITTGRLQDADLPITNRAISRAPITISVRGGEGFLRGANNINLIEIESGGTKTAVVPNTEYPLGKNGRVVFSACFPMEYKVYKERFLVLKMFALEDCIRNQLKLTLNDVWRNFVSEFGKLIILGT
jgi:class 3 adenylate cyclase